MNEVTFCTAPQIGGPSCIDCEKAFDGVDRECHWKLLRHFKIPEKITSFIQNSYEGLTCSVIHNGQLTDAFPVLTGVRLGCLLLPFLFLLAIDWIMKQSASQKEMEYDGHRSHNRTTWISLIWLSCPTPKSRCKKRRI